MKQLILLTASLAILSGCPSLSTLQTPETVPEGQLRLAAAPEYIGVGTGDDFVGLPTTELAMRYGAAENFDLGFKIYPIGFEFGVKWQFLDTEGFDAAAAPSVSGIYISSDGEGAGAFYFHLPVLFGANIGEALTIGFGPKLMYALLTSDVGSDVDSVEGLFGGLYFGLPIHISERFTLAPEINVYSNLTGDAGAFNGFLVQGGVAFMFDLFNQAPATADPAVPAGY